MLKYLFPSLFPLEDPILIFAIVLLLFLFSPILMARFKLPGMIGLLLAGAVLGPHALALLERDASFVLLGSVGLIYIMFTAALEIDLSVFKKYGLDGLVFGLLTFAIPMGIGLLVAYYVLQFETMPAVLLASMFASHTLLAYPLISKKGLSSNRAVIATVAGTIITDILALLVLAVVASASQGELNEALWWKLGVSMTIFVSSIFYFLPKLGRYFFIKFPEDLTAQFVFILSSVFICAALSHFAGLEPIVGAFLSGLALNRLIPHNSLLMNRLNFTGEAIFIPFFLLSVGMILDPKVLFGSFMTWVVAISMTVTVILTKWSASRVAGFIFRYNEQEKRVVFGLSIVQAAATLAAAIVGHRLGIFDDSVINGTIVMMLVTCIIGPYFVSQNLFGLEVVEENTEILSEYDKILIPISSENNFESNIELATMLKSHNSKTPLYPAYFVTDKALDLNEQNIKAQKLLQFATAKINSAGFKASTTKRVDQTSAQALKNTFKEIGATIAILPWNFDESKNNFKFGELLDEALLIENVKYLITRLNRPITSALKINIVIPQFNSVQDINEISKLVIHFAIKTGLKINIFSTSNNLEDIKFIFDNIGAKLNKEYKTYSNPLNWLSQFDEINNHSDMIIVIGSISDRKRLNSNIQYESVDIKSYVYTLAQKYPDQNIIFAI